MDIFKKILDVTSATAAPDGGHVKQVLICSLHSFHSIIWVKAIHGSLTFPPLNHTDRRGSLQNVDQRDFLKTLLDALFNCNSFL